MTNFIIKFIKKHNTRPFLFISIYIWFFLGLALGNKDSPWCALPYVFIGFMNIIILLLVSEND